MQPPEPPEGRAHKRIGEPRLADSRRGPVRSAAVILYEDENGQTVFEYDWTMSCDPSFRETGGVPEALNLYPSS